MECATKSHLDLACGELWDTQEKLKEKIIHFKKLEESVNILYEQLEKISVERKRLLVLLLLSLVLLLLCLTSVIQSLEDRVQTKLEEKVSVIQSLNEKNVGVVKTKLEKKISVIQSLNEKNVGVVKTKLEEKISVIQSLI